MPMIHTDIMSSLLLVFRCIWPLILIFCATCEATVTFVKETTVVDVHSTVGRLKTLHVHGDTACQVECYLDAMCVSAGYADTFSGACQLYSVDLADFAHNVISQEGTVIYKAVCSNTDYTYVRWLNLCIKRYTTMLDAVVAQQQCEADDATLMEVDSNDKRVYLRETLLQIHGPTAHVRYLLGGRRTATTDWSWENAGNITIENGAIFWGLGEPNSVDDCMALEPVNNGDDVAFVAVDCNNSCKFMCAVTAVPLAP